MMSILGSELEIPLDLYSRSIGTSKKASLSLLELSSPQISGSKETASCAFHSDSSCVESPSASQSKPNISKLESYKLLNYFD
jgi:hypothetical protein